MDKREALAIAEKYISEVRKKYPVSRALLFGSFAKGNFNEDSDIDVAIVMNNVPDIIEMQIDLMKVRRNVDLRIEPHPFSLSNFEPSNPMVNDILKYGIEVKAIA